MALHASDTTAIYPPGGGKNGHDDSGTWRVHGTATTMDGTAMSMPRAAVVRLPPWNFLVPYGAFMTPHGTSCILMGLS